jgi:hypothetical protein
VLARVEHPGLASFESGVRIWLAAEDEPPRLLWVGSGERQPPWMRGEGLPADSEGFPAAGLPRRALSRERGGRVVLLPAAAAWWVHEMGHAALEARGHGQPGGGGGLVVVDDPGLAPWPAGYERDDLGETGVATVLWDERGCHRPAPSGRRRRASVRQPARPSLSATRLVVDPAAVTPSLEEATDLPVIDRVDAARFDPQRRAVYLRIRRTGGEAVDGVAVIRADEGWGGVRLWGDGHRNRMDLAACSRQGGLNAVMVGAPTLALEVDQICWASPPPTVRNAVGMPVTKGAPRRGALGENRTSVDQGTECSACPAVPEEGSKRSSLVEARAAAGGVWLTRGGEQGGWGPDPRPAPDRTRPEHQLWQDVPEPGAEAEVLRRALVGQVPERFADRLEVVVTRARVTETDAREADGSAAEERDLTTAAVSFHGPEGLALWSRIAPLSPAATDWPAGWVPAVARELAGWRELPVLAGLDPGPVIVDVFAMADLLRGAALGWLAGEPPPGARVAPSAVCVLDAGLDVATGAEEGAPREWVAEGRLRPAASRAPLVRPSWRERPRPGWHELALGFEAKPEHAWPSSAVLVSRIARVGNSTFGSGQLIEGGEARGVWGPWPLPSPTWWLLRLAGPCGAPVPDGTGAPVRVPPCRVDAWPF